MELKHPKKRIAVLSGIGACVVVTGALIAILVASAAPSSAASPYSASKLNRISAVESQLMIEQSNQAVKKPSYAEGLKEAQAAGNKLQGAAVPTAPARVAGFIQMHQGPFSAATFTVDDVYQGPARDSWLLVYAGSAPAQVGNTPNKAAVTVYAEPTPGGPMTPLGIFTAPGDSTSVTAVSISGSDLALRTADGQALTFDFSSLTYAS